MWMLYIIAEAHRAVSLNRLNNRRTALWERCPQQLKLVWENNHASRQKTGIYLYIYIRLTLTSLIKSSNMRFTSASNARLGQFGQYTISVNRSVPPCSLDWNLFLVLSYQQSFSNHIHVETQLIKQSGSYWYLV